jgi:hypothetical protein
MPGGGEIYLEGPRTIFELQRAGWEKRQGQKKALIHCIINFNTTSLDLISVWDFAFRNFLISII